MPSPRTPKVSTLGKPAAAFFEAALAFAGNIAPGAVMMIGDDVVGDVEGAINAGLRGCLVRTGKYRPGDESQPDTRFPCVDSVVEAVDLALG